VKYIAVIMRADNKGEGGIMALMALAVRVTPEGRSRVLVVMAGIIGAALFFGDGVITPAISVLSAVEGLRVVSPAFEHLVVPLSLLVLILLFAAQRFGTGSVGGVFGPVCAVWFAVLALLGIAEIVRHPQVLAALSPHYAIAFVLEHGVKAFLVLGGVVLAITGGEALYADMGHFGRRPIAITWFCYVMPCLLLNYFGQGALLISNPAAIENPFYLLAPSWFRLPLVFLSTAATVIASQAVISGAFSIARQAMLLGYFPRLIVHHTSETERGQVYIPQINAALLLGVVFLVLAFRSSDALAAAYGIAVTATMTVDSVLAAIVAGGIWGWATVLVVPVFGVFLLVDLAFFTATALKFLEGGWFPVILGLAMFALMSTWRQGRDILYTKWRQESLPLASFVARLPQSSHIIRVPGTAVFMTGNPDYVPSALMHNLKHNKVLHERVVFVNVATEDVPEVPAAARATLEELGPGIHRVRLRYGFKETPNVPRALQGLRPQGLDIRPMETSFFLGRDTLVQAMVPRMPAWREWLFIAMARNAVPATEFFRIPTDRVVELGVQVAI